MLYLHLFKNQMLFVTTDKGAAPSSGHYGNGQAWREAPDAAVGFSAQPAPDGHSTFSNEDQATLPFERSQGGPDSGGAHGPQHVTAHAGARGGAVALLQGQPTNLSSPHADASKRSILAIRKVRTRIRPDRPLTKPFQTSP